MGGVNEFPIFNVYLFSNDDCFYQGGVFVTELEKIIRDEILDQVKNSSELSRIYFLNGAYYIMPLLMKCIQDRNTYMQIYFDDRENPSVAASAYHKMVKQCNDSLIQLLETTQKVEL